MSGFPAWRRMFAAVMIALTFDPAGSRAATFLDTMPADTVRGPYFALNNVGGRGQSLAVSFSIASAATVNSVLTSIYGGPGAVTLGIMGDAGGLPSNAYLYSSVATYPVFNTGYASLSGLDWGLATGSYWLTAFASDGGFFAWIGGSGGTGVAYTDGPVTNWVWDSGSKTPAAQITGITAAIPEPDTYAMMLAGLGLLGLMARRRQAQS